MEKVISVFLSVASLLIPQLKKADSKAGIKETKEALIAANEVSLFICEKLKDGIQFSDATDFYSKVTSDEAFKAKVMAGYDKYQEIPVEVKDIDAGEGLEVMVEQVKYVPKYLACFEKQETVS